MGEASSLLFPRRKLTIVFSVVSAPCRERERERETTTAQQKSRFLPPAAAALVFLLSLSLSVLPISGSRKLSLKL